MEPYNFNVGQITESLICWIKDWFLKNGNSCTKAVLGISGGKDSTVVAGLLVKALGKERVIGVLMPNGEQPDIEDSLSVVKHLGIKYFVVNINNAYKGLTSEIKEQTGLDLTPQYLTNTPARLRMTTLYGIAANIGNCRIANTCNRSEDVQGYSTHYGDSAGDFAPLSKLTTEEVVAIGDYIGMPFTLTHKVPSDGMCGKTDEDNLGWKYSEINKVIRLNEKGEHYDAIIKRYNGMKFKLDIVRIPAFQPNLPDYFFETYNF
ncbi:MAG: NAD(+) synthase [Paludibacteraceae bacterium]|nr:NAD(+) synthase [Paludibacteraceae bacterium]